MTPYQRAMQKQTAAYEALQFIRRFYPWRERATTKPPTPVAATPQVNAIAS